MFFITLQVLASPSIIPLAGENTITMTDFLYLNPGDNTVPVPTYITKPGSGYMVCSSAVSQMPVDGLDGGAGNKFFFASPSSWSQTGHSTAVVRVYALTASFLFGACAVWSDELKSYISDVTAIGSMVTIIPKPTIEVSASKIDLGECMAPKTLEKDFSVKTTWQVIEGINSSDTVSSANLSAKIIHSKKGGDKNLHILDMNGNDLLQGPVSISTNSYTEQRLKVQLACPSDPGEYEWSVSLVYEIK